MLVVFRESLPTTIHIGSVLGILGLGLGIVCIGSLYFYGFKNFDLNLGNIVTSAELVILLLLNAAFLHEYPNSNEIIGGVFILLSLIVISINAFKKSSAGEILA